jgi:creatinine amidohydrolase
MRFALPALALGVASAAIQAAPGTRYERMAPGELKVAIETCPVAFLPAGILEWHGEQSACGLDALKAESLAQLAADLLGGVAFPQIWFGPDVSTPFDPARYPRGTLTVNKRLYDAGMEELFCRLEAMGFKVAIHLSGHYPGVVPEIAERFNRRHRMRVLSISENLVVQGLPSGDHAGAWETSVLMALRPGLVDLHRLPALPATTRPAGEVIPPAYEFHPMYGLYGIYALDPRIWANRTYGRKGVEAVLDGLQREVGKALGSADYGKGRYGIPWANEPVDGLEVRYDHLLPGGWMERFEARPIVYVPLAPADGSLEPTVATAVAWARAHGGMAFPPLAYAPAQDPATTAISEEVFANIASETTARLCDMDFRVIVLVCSPSLSRQLRSRPFTLAGGQACLVMADAPGDPPPALAAAIRRMIPQDATTQPLAGPWQVNGRHTLNSLAEDLYGSGDTRLYECAFQCSEEQASGAAMIDLGNVQNRCELRLNDGTPLVDHWPSYRFILTGMLQPGANRMKITVKHQPQPTLVGAGVNMV